MDYQQVVVYFTQLGMNLSFLLLAAAGLAIIFSMMNIINLAHGDLIMLGAFGTSAAFATGMPMILAMAAGVAAAIVAGLLLERVFIRRLYKRPFDAMVVTWAVGLVISQSMLILVGPTMPSIPTPFGKLDIGNYAFSIYQLLLIPMALGLFALLYFVFKYTRWGIEARAAMLDAGTAEALGINVKRIYSLTFALGAGLAGLTGAVCAPTMSIVFSMGSAFVVQAFSTVIVGGANVFLGTTPAAFVLAIVQTLLTQVGGTLFGVIGLLATVIVTIRLLPEGFGSIIGRFRQ